MWYNLVPLIGSSVEATLVDQLTQVDITQEYVNNESEEIEASYLFPLDERAAVCGFEAMIGGKRIVGVAKEKEKAERWFSFFFLRMKSVFFFFCFFISSHMLNSSLFPQNREYRAAISRGDGAYLLEEKKADIFKLKVGNIPPGESVKIKITYVAEMKSELTDLKKRFILPTVIAPRYSPPSDLFAGLSFS